MLFGNPPIIHRIRDPEQGARMKDAAKTSQVGIQLLRRFWPQRKDDFDGIVSPLGDGLTAEATGVTGVVVHSSRAAA